MTTVSRRTVMIAVAAGGLTSAVASRSWGAASGNLTALTLSEASARIRAGTLTSTQLTRAFLDRIAVYEPKINAFIGVMAEQALAQARELDEEAAAGKFRSPLHGIPIAVKDNIDTAGMRTTAASAVFDDRVPTEDADVWRRLKAAGVVAIGKANMDEFASSGFSVVSAFGPVRNPWALDRTAGGSSGGSAAAVAAEMCLGALGTDTGGSVRMPAANCNLVGLKPTYGLVSIRGIVPLVLSLDTCGPITRTVEDAAMLLTQMTGYDKLDIASVDHPREDYVAAMNHPVNGLRIGIPRAPYFDALDADTSRCIEAAIGVVAKLTQSVKDVALPPIMDGMALGAEAQAYHHAYRNKSGRYMLATRRGIQGRETSMNDPKTGACSTKIIDYVETKQRLELLRRTIDDAFTDFDLVVLPTNRTVFSTIDEALELVHSTTPADPWLKLANCGPFNIMGLPAISIPCGFSAAGLPLGMMIAGPRFSEGRILALARAYEAATEWHKRKPALQANTAVPPLKFKQSEHK